MPKAEMYSEISMKFLDGGARAIMHARTLIDSRAAEEGGGGGKGRLSDARSLIMHSFQAAVIILHIAGAGVPVAAFGNFSRHGGKERPAISVVARTRARGCGHLNVVVAI